MVNLVRGNDIITEEGFSASVDETNSSGKSGISDKKSKVFPGRGFVLSPEYLVILLPD